MNEFENMSIEEQFADVEKQCDEITEQISDIKERCDEASLSFTFSNCALNSFCTFTDDWLTAHC